MFEKFRSFNTFTHHFLVQGLKILLSLSFSFHILRPSTEQNFPRESERASGIKVSEKSWWGDSISLEPWSAYVISLSVNKHKAFSVYKTYF